MPSAWLLSASHSPPVLFLCLKRFNIHASHSVVVKVGVGSAQSQQNKKKEVEGMYSSIKCQLRVAACHGAQPCTLQAAATCFHAPCACENSMSVLPLPLRLGIDEKEDVMAHMARENIIQAKLCAAVARCCARKKHGLFMLYNACCHKLPMHMLLAIYSATMLHCRRKKENMRHAHAHTMPVLLLFVELIMAMSILSLSKLGERRR